MTRRMIVTIPDSVDATTEEIINEVWEVWACTHLSDADIAIDNNSNALEMFIDPHDALLDQGITRLQLLSFLRGEHSARWNGTDLQWVRYRAHQVDRECSPDATIIRLTYTGHQTGTNTAVIEAVPNSDVDAATALRVIDTIIEAAIAHHGPDGVA